MKIADLPTITVSDLKSFGPCYRGDELESLLAFARTRERWNVLDVLATDHPAEDRLWLVLRPRLIPEPWLHELACRFAEEALLAERADGREPNEKSWAAIAAKRAWLRGEIDDEELRFSRAAARAAAESAKSVESSLAAAESAARPAVESAWLAVVARSSARSTERAAALAAESAPWAAAALAASLRLKQCETVRDFVLSQIES